VRRPVSSSVAEAPSCTSGPRKTFKVEPDRRDVLAEISGIHFESGRPEHIEQFARDEVDLPQVWRPRLSARQISVPDKLAVVGVPFDPMSRRESDGEAGSLAEPMLGIECYGDHRSPQNRLFREVVRGVQLGGCPFEAKTLRSTATWRPSRSLASSLASKTIGDALSSGLQISLGDGGCDFGGAVHDLFILLGRSIASSLQRDTGPKHCLPSYIRANA